ncbi:MAG: hypothetical protein JSR90_15635 [Proteobacteria bacterium]|nr:hypothetical protein [Pseudomonadota bacterium]
MAGNRLMARRIARIVGLMLLCASAMATSANGDDRPWLALCRKCLSPTVVESSGLGTTHAVAVARITREGATDWCGNWQPDHVASCVQEALASDDARLTYRATADCLHGRITAIDGVTYSLAGVWTSGIGKGRTKWRDPSGQVLGTEGPAGGLGISQQWEVLCPSAAAHSSARPPTSPPARPASPGASPHYAFAVGQEIEAKYGRDWVRGRVTRIWPHEGAHGNEPAYDVQLVNGKRGILPTAMLRPVPSP